MLISLCVLQFLCYKGPLKYALFSDAVFVSTYTASWVKMYNRDLAHFGQLLVWLPAVDALSAQYATLPGRG